jgi:hypothetical protein
MSGVNEGIPPLFLLILLLKTFVYHQSIAWTYRGSAICHSMETNKKHVYSASRSHHVGRLSFGGQKANCQNKIKTWNSPQIENPSFTQIITMQVNTRNMGLIYSSSMPSSAEHNATSSSILESSSPTPAARKQWDYASDMTEEDTLVPPVLTSPSSNSCGDNGPGTPKHKLCNTKLPFP